MLFCAMSSPVHAADLNRASKSKPSLNDVVLENERWSGFYINGSLIASDRSIGSDSLWQDGTNRQVPEWSNVHSRSLGAAFGLGYDWQFENKVIGLVADVAKLAHSNEQCRPTDSFAARCYDNGWGFMSLHDRASWGATLRIRAGFDLGSFLVYSTAGIAVSNNISTITTDCRVLACGNWSNSPYATYTTGTFQKRRVVPTVGLGVDYNVHGNWSLTSLYLLTVKSKVENAVYGTGTYGRETSSWAKSVSEHSVRLGISYKL